MATRRQKKKKKMKRNEYSLKAFTHCSSSCLTLSQSTEIPLCEDMNHQDPACALAAFQQGAAWTSPPARNSPKDNCKELKKICIHSEKNTLLKTKPMWNGLQGLEVLSGLLLHFPNSQAHAIPSSHWEGGHWTPSASLLALMASRGATPEQSLLSITIIAQHFTSPSFPHLVKPLLLPSHGKARLKNRQWRTIAKDYLKLKSALCAMNWCKNQPQALIPCCKSTDALNLSDASHAFAVSLPISTQIWVFPQACTW